MAKAEAAVEELVGMIERGELRLPEMQRRYVWRSTRVRDLLDSLYRGYPSGAILLWETDEKVPLQDFAVTQQGNPYQSTRLLLDGQQRLTSLSAVIRGEPVNVRGRRRPLELLFNLEHPEELAVVTEVNEDGGDEDEYERDLIEDEADSSEDELQRRFDRMTFVVATKKLEQLPHWVKVSEVFKTDEDAPFLERAGIDKISDARYKKYSSRAGSRIAAQRAEPIAVHAEMSSINLVFLLPGALAARGAAIAKGFVTSLNLGAGQFCTNPGLLLAIEGPRLDAFMPLAAAEVRGSAAATMLASHIHRAYETGLARLSGLSGVTVVARGERAEAAAARRRCWSRRLRLYSPTGCCRKRCSARHPFSSGAATWRRCARWRRAWKDS